MSDTTFTLLLFPRTMSITFVPNAKRPGTQSGNRYAAYSAASTLIQAEALGATKADIKWDIEHGFLRYVLPRVVPTPPVPDADASDDVPTECPVTPRAKLLRAPKYVCAGPGDGKKCPGVCMLLARETGAKIRPFQKIRLFCSWCLKPKFQKTAKPFDKTEWIAHHTSPSWQRLDAPVKRQSLRTASPPL